MSLSLAERKRKGLSEPYYWAPSGQVPGEPLLPLPFPGPLPSLHPLDTQLVRGRVDSDTSDVLASIINDLGVSPAAPAEPGRCESARDRNTVYNGELLLVVQKVTEPTPSSRRTRRPALRAA